MIRNIFLCFNHHNLFNAFNISEIRGDTLKPTDIKPFKGQACDKKSIGFTLIELLMVMLIIGIISTTAIISYSPPPFQKTKEQLNVLLDQINIAQEKALLDSIPLGLLFFQQKYIFLQIENKTWIEYSQFPEVSMDLHDAQLVVDDISVNLPNADYVQEIFPQIVFTPSAEMTPFQLTLQVYDEDSEQSAIFELETDILGRGKLTQY